MAIQRWSVAGNRNRLALTGWDREVNLRSGVI